jgi:multisubunit Na+/H+ antiporter MnhB subunit
MAAAVVGFSDLVFLVSLFLFFLFFLFSRCPNVARQQLARCGMALLLLLL